MNNKTTNVRYLAQLALLAAIEVVMKLMGLGSVPVGPLYMSFLTVPIAVDPRRRIRSGQHEGRHHRRVGYDKRIFPDQPD